MTPNSTDTFTHTAKDGKVIVITGIPIWRQKERDFGGLIMFPQVSKEVKQQVQDIIKAQLKNMEPNQVVHCPFPKVLEAST